MPNEQTGAVHATTVYAHSDLIGYFPEETLAPLSTAPVYCFLSRPATASLHSSAGRTEDSPVQATQHRSAKKTRDQGAPLVPQPCRRHKAQQGRKSLLGSDWASSSSLQRPVSPVPLLQPDRSPTEPEIRIWASMPPPPRKENGQTSPPTLLQVTLL